MLPSAPNQLTPEICTGLPCASTIWLPEVCRKPAAMPAEPGSVADASEMLMPGVVVTSSLVMVPVAVPREMVAPVGLDSATVKVSVGSTAVSPVTLTVMVWEVTPAAKVRVPVALVKSAPAVAVPLAVAYVTVTGGVVADLDRVTVKVALDVPLLPRRGWCRRSRCWVWSAGY